MPRRKIVHDPPLPPLRRSTPNPTRQARSDDILGLEQVEQGDLLGEVVIFHSDSARKADMPAICQEIFADKSCRIYVFGAMGAYHTIAVEGKLPGQWSRKKLA